MAQSAVTAHGRRPPTEARGRQEGLLVSVLGSFPWLLLLVGDTRAAQPEKELLSLSLPLPTPTHSDGLFVVTSAASGGPGRGEVGGRAGDAALDSALVTLRKAAPEALFPGPGTGFLSLIFSPERPPGPPLCTQPWSLFSQIPSGTYPPSLEPFAPLKVSPLSLHGGHRGAQWGLPRAGR